MFFYWHMYVNRKFTSDCPVWHLWNCPPYCLSYSPWILFNPKSISCLSQKSSLLESYNLLSLLFGRLTYHSVVEELGNALVVCSFISFRNLLYSTESSLMLPSGSFSVLVYGSVKVFSPDISLWNDDGQFYSFQLHSCYGWKWPFLAKKTSPQNRKAFIAQSKHMIFW